jgi:hypothetical protein
MTDPIDLNARRNAEYNVKLYSTKEPDGYHCYVSIDGGLYRRIPIRRLTSQRRFRAWYASYSGRLPNRLPKEEYWEMTRKLINDAKVFEFDSKEEKYKRVR